MITVTYTFNSESELKEFVNKASSEVVIPEIGGKEFFSEANKRKQWTQFETDYLISNYGLKTSKYIAHQLGRKPIAIHSKVFALRTAGVPIRMLRNKSN